MVDTFTLTTNKAIIKPDNNTYTGHWNEPVNTDWDIIDRAFGGTYTVSLTSSNVTLTQTNVQNTCILLQGTLTANVTVYFPSGVSGFYIVNNTTSGAFNVALLSAGGSPGRGVVAAQGAYTFIWSNGSNIDIATNASLTAGSGITISGGAVSIDAPLSTTYGGTGFDGPYSNGQLLIGNTLSGSLVPATLTSGSGISITNGNGTITIASSSGVAFDPTVSYTFTGTQTFNGTSSSLASILTNAAETATCFTSGASGNINYYVTNQSVIYSIPNATSNWNLYFRASSSTTLNTIMGNGQSITVAFLAQCGSTGYYNTGITIDGTSVTPVWQNGPPASGYAGALNVYTYTIIKTDTNTFKVLASLVPFY
jgi:hypothetical protein